MFPVLSNVNNVNTNIHVQIFMSQRFWFYLHKYLGVGLYGHMIRVCLQETVKLSFEVVVLVSFPPALGIENSLCSLDSGPLSGMWFANVFFFFSADALLFHSLYDIFQRTGVFNVDDDQSVAFKHFLDHTFGIISKNSLPNSSSWKCSIFSSGNFTGLGFTTRPLVHFLSFLSSEIFICLGPESNL